MAPVPVVGVVGGGLAGALVAIHLLRVARARLRIVVVERRPEIGRGIAYSTSDPAHLLNVPIERMSSLCDDPMHLTRWAEARLGRRPAPGAYLPRQLYGEYIGAALAEYDRPAAGRTVEHVRDEVVDLRSGAAGAELVLGSGGVIACDQVVLALGNLPSPPPGWLIEHPRVVADPWADGALEPTAETTLVVGTGLTAVDVTTSLCPPGTAGRVVAVSTSGQLPFAHLPGRREASPPPSLPEGPIALRALVELVAGHVDRMQAEGYDWRDALDGMRPRIPELWRRLSLDDRRRFVAEYARVWEVRRHRMAPAAAARIRELRGAGRLRLVAGRVVAARPLRDAIEVELTARDGTRSTLVADRVVACTGPCTKVGTTPDPLVRRLLSRGLASPDALGLGLRCGPRAELLDAAGRPLARVRVIGPPLRGELWETTAVAEIRRQAEQLASELSATLGLSRPGWVQARIAGAE